MIRRGWLWLTLFASIWAHAEHSHEAHQWLAKMLQATSAQNYQGIVVTGNQQRWDSYQISHAHINGEEFEWVEQLTGPSKLAVRRQDVLFCGHTEAQHREHRPLQNPLRPRALLPLDNRAYQLQLGRTGRVAGRLAQQINIQPTDHDRYAMNLWLDAETAVLLKTEVLADNDVLVRAQFASIDFEPRLTEESFIPIMAGHSLTIVPKEQQIDAAVSWLPQWLPVEFNLKFAQQQNDGQIRLLYFDGIASFSIFIEDAAERSPAVEQKTVQKTWNATSAVVLTTGQGEQVKKITAVGEVPAETLARVAQSIAAVTFKEETQ